MRGRILLAVGLAAGAVLAAPAAAQAATTGHFCNTSDGLCMSMNGTVGDLVYGKPYDRDNQQVTEVHAATVCTHNGQKSQYVQWTGKKGDTENCPFTTAGWDQKYVGEEIVAIFNPVYLNFAVAKASTGEVYQAVTGSGSEWIQVGDRYVNVSVTDANNIPEYLCDQGSDNPLSVDINSCYWHFRS